MAFQLEVGIHNNDTNGVMCSNSCQTSGGGGVPVYSYKRCGRGLTPAPRLQFCCGRRSLASIHGRTWTENFRICTLEYQTI